MKKRVLITGSNGFLGSHLLRDLSKDFHFQEIHQHQLSKIDPEMLEGETFIHLAGVSSVPEGEKDVLKAYEVNCALTLALADVFFRKNPKGHFIFASTGQVYDEKAEVPYTEKSSINATNVYSRTKLAAEEGLEAIAKALTGHLTVLRLFNQTHKSQSPNFFLPSIYSQLKNSSEGSTVHLKVGNINVQRDLSAVVDFVSAVKALLLAAPSQQIEVFNICSGGAKNLKEVATKLAQAMGKKIEFEIDPSRIRNNDREVAYGSSEAFQKAYHWKPVSSSVDNFIREFLKD